MKKKKPVLLMLHLVVVQWLYLASAQFNYPLVTFSTDWVTPEKYNSFIASVRAAVESTTKEKSNGIPVLISQDDPLAVQTYLNVTLTNKAGQSISLKMDATVVSFTDYEAGKYSCNITSATCFSDPFSSSVATTQPPESSAAGRGDVAGDGGLGLGATAAWRVKDLDEAISSLFLFAHGRASKQSFRRGVATCEMMIANAAKFRYIQRRLGAGMWEGDGNGISDNPSLHGLLARWPALSSSVQQSNQGAFPAPVAVDRSNGKTALQVDNVPRAVPLVSFLEHDKCGSSSSRTLHLPRVIRSVVQEAAAAAELAACTKAQPTMHIVGAEGKCVDVADHKYVEGAQVILWPCRSNDYDDMNQLWSFKSDGTIRINGNRWCLRASSASAGDSVVIDNCGTISPWYHAVWDVRADGTIALRSDGGLVLTTTSTANRTGLTLERDGGGTGQGWTPTNDTAPLVTTVLGYRDYYLQVSAAGAVVLAVNCGPAAAEWALYPDGSIRRGRSATTQQCLAPDAAERVVATACSVAGAARQRWVFRNDGSVLNSGTGKVMDVRPRLGARPSCASQGVATWEVVVSEPAPGSPTQEWVIML